MHPLDVVRSSFDNWSDSELAAVSVAMHKASAACQQARPKDYTGDDLFDLAHLCSLGQSWNLAHQVAQEYIARGPEAHRTRAYAMDVTALVRMNATEDALKTTCEMLSTQPYDAEVAYTLQTMKGLMEQMDRPDALSLALSLAIEEHPKILEALRHHAPLTEAHGEAVISLGSLYESAMRLAFLQRYNMDKDGAAKTVADLEEAVPTETPLGAEDRNVIDRIRTQYRLLGAKLPALEVKRSLFSDTSKAQIDPDFGEATVLMLFPDWCISCRGETKTLTQFAAANSDTPIHAYGLIFADNFGADDFGAPGQSASTHEENLKDLAGTSTLLVTPAAARSLGGIDYPLGIVVDKAGIVRFVGVLPVDAFNGDGYIEQVIVRAKVAEMTDSLLQQKKK